MTTPTTKFNGGIRYLHTRTESPVTAATLVLIHGLGTSLDFWWPVVPALSERIDVLAFDLPGSGDSRLLDDDYSVQTVAQESLTFLDRVLSGPRILVGHSLGALIALEMIAIDPAAARRLIMADPVLFAVESVLTSPREAIRNPKLFGITLTQFLGVVLPGSISGQLATSKTFRQLALSSYVHDPASLDPAVMQQAMVKVGGWKTLRLLQVFRAAQSVDLDSSFERLALPFDLIRGDSDPLVTAADRERLGTSPYLGSETVLPDCGHLPMVEQPDLLVDALLAIAESGDRWDD